VECRHFYEAYHKKDPRNRCMFVVSAETANDVYTPKDLKKKQHLRNVRDMVWVLARDSITRLTKRLEYEETRVGEAFNDYHYSRFWHPGWGQSEGIHIFTCARDQAYDPTWKRGRGGRTTIDKWDYQTVLDLTRFFGARYPDVNVTIEDPVSKLSLAEIKTLNAGERFADMRDKLRNRDCVIVGSPDVSDFAEIVLARAHNLPAYSEKRVKTRGFVHIKDRQQTPSVGYWIKGDNEREGIARIDSGEIVPYETDMHEGKETTYGILIVANNPFNDRPGLKTKILILSGFTGIATNGIAKLIADKKYRRQFYALDQKIELDMQFEALISTRFGYTEGDTEVEINARDARELDPSADAVQFQELVRI
jgi:hypothetical protein